MTRRASMAILGACAALLVVLSAVSQAAVAAPGALASSGTLANNVIIELDVAFSPEGQLEPDEVSRQRAWIAAAQDSVLRRVPEDQVAEIHRYHFVPAVAARLSDAALATVKDVPGVRSVHENSAGELALADSVPLIGADRAWSAGYSGKGQTIAILDTGVDKNHPFLAGKVVAEACFSRDLCPNGRGVYEGAGTYCPFRGSFCSHGTHVAGIAAGKGEAMSGVARDANLIAVQIASHSAGWLEPVIAALEQVYSWREEFDIAAVNMSFRVDNGNYPKPCDEHYPTLKQAIDNLRSVGIASVAASGNDRYRDRLGSPACISTSISVGATTEADAPADFSQSADFLSVMAPGTSILSSVPAEWYSSPAFRNWNGTSMAAPHVAGAWAVLKSKRPEASVSKIESVLRATGTPVYDSGQLGVKPRIQVDRAVEQLSQEELFPGVPYPGIESIDLEEGIGARFDGSGKADRAGRAVASAGDFDGDGHEDVIVGTPYADSNGRADSGAAYVVFGPIEVGTPVDLGQLGKGGVRIDGAQEGHLAGFAAGSAGDVNGDGLDDVIVGASRSSYRAAYVVFGSRSSRVVKLNKLSKTQAGIELSGPPPLGLRGYAVAGAGDVNGDGLDDVVVGAAGGHARDWEQVGRAAIVFGARSSKVIDLGKLVENGNGIPMRADVDGDAAGYAVSGIGDVNGDGLADVLVGAPGTDPRGRSNAGAAYIVYGKSSSTPVRLSKLASAGTGVEIRGAKSGDWLGGSVAKAGDLNDDGIPDLTIGAPYADYRTRGNAGAAYVLFGGRRDGVIDLARLGDASVRIDGPAAAGHAGTSVSSAGDVDRDGLADLLVGVPDANFNDRPGSGSAYVLFNKGLRPEVDLALLRTNGFRIDGAAKGDSAGWSVASIGGAAEGDPLSLVTGAPNADNGSEDSGSAYVLSAPSFP